MPLSHINQKPRSLISNDNSGQIAAEYCVYAYSKPLRAGGKCPWIMPFSSAQLEDSFREAERIFQSGKYMRVELRKKYYDERRAFTVDMTLRVFEDKTLIRAPQRAKG